MTKDELIRQIRQAQSRGAGRREHRLVLAGRDLRPLAGIVEAGLAVDPDAHLGPQRVRGR